MIIIIIPCLKCRCCCGVVTLTPCMTVTLSCSSSPYDTDLLLLSAAPISPKITSNTPTRRITPPRFTSGSLRPATCGGNQRTPARHVTREVHCGRCSSIQHTDEIAGEYLFFKYLIKKKYLFADLLNLCSYILVY